MPACTHLMRLNNLSFLDVPAMGRPTLCPTPAMLPHTHHNVPCCAQNRAKPTIPMLCQPTSSHVLQLCSALAAGSQPKVLAGYGQISDTRLRTALLAALDTSAAQRAAAPYAAAFSAATRRTQQPQCPHGAPAGPEGPGGAITMQQPQQTDTGTPHPAAQAQGTPSVPVVAVEGGARDLVALTGLQSSLVRSLQARTTPGAAVGAGGEGVEEAALAGRAGGSGGGGGHLGEEGGGGGAGARFGALPGLHTHISRLSAAVQGGSELAAQVAAQLLTPAPPLTPSTKRLLHEIKVERVGRPHVGRGCVFYAVCAGGGGGGSGPQW